MVEAKTKKAVTKKKEKTVEEYNHELVTVNVRRPEGVKDESCTVTVNGKNYQIMYGKDVKVPRFVANIIKESERNTMIAEENARQALKSRLLGEF